MADLDISSLRFICSKPADDNHNLIQVSDKAVATFLRSCKYTRDNSVTANLRLASDNVYVHSDCLKIFTDRKRQKNIKCETGLFPTKDV